MSRENKERGNWPLWPAPASDEAIARWDAHRFERRRQLIEAARLSPEQVERLDAIFVDLGNQIESAFDTLIAAHVRGSALIPSETLQEYKVLVGRAVHRATTDTAALVPGGKETLRKLPFVVPRQVRLVVMQKVTSVGTLEEKQ